MFGLIGNGETCVLVSHFASIDWLCVPRFDSPTLFARALDYERGGYLGLTVLDGKNPRPFPRGQHRYLSGTNVLESFHEFGGRRIRVTDFMVPGRPRLWRLVGVSGAGERLTLGLKIDPRPHYNGIRPRITRADGRVVVSAPGQSICLWSPDWERAGKDYRWSVIRPSVLSLLLTYGPDPAAAELEARKAPDGTADYRRTVAHWASWSSQVYPGLQIPTELRAIYLRSLLALRLLMYEPTGAVVAAPTTSFPETVGGDANWDYRFCWVRDSALVADAFALAGLHDEARKILRFLLGLVPGGGKPYPHPLVAVDGTLEGTRERTVSTLEGFGRSRPVRVGNAAVNQYQGDLEGEVLAALWTYVRWSGDRPFLLQQYARVRRLAEWVARSWKRKDASIWEFRLPEGLHVHTRALCWTALDSGAALAREAGHAADARRWEEVAREVRRETLRRGYSPARKAFVRAYGRPRLDASVLMVPLSGMLPVRHPRVQSTLQTLSRELEFGGLLRRFEEERGAFLLTSLWWAEALALQRETGRAQKILERCVHFASNEVGLLAEEFDSYHDRLLGNMPQALSHQEFVRAVMLLCGRSGALAKSSNRTGGR